MAPVNLTTGPGYGYGAPGTVGYGANYFPNPFAGNIYKGIPTTPGQTPYGPMLSQLQQYNYNPSQLRGIANQQVQAQIGSQLGASYANQTAEQQQLASMQNRASGLAAALGSFGPDYAGAMQSAYNNAAQTIGSLGPGVVSQGQQSEQSNLDAAKASVAGATAGQGQVSSYDPSQLASTLSTTGVQMPGNSLALQGYNAAQMGLYGAMADKGQVQGVAQYYQQQAVNALQQRTAERAAIIAQQPQLFQQALEQQRQDEGQTQDRIANTLGAAQQYIAGRMGLALQRAQAQNQWLTQVAGMTHVNPYTQQPLAGYVPVQLKDGSTVVVSYKDAAVASHYADLGAYYAARGAATQTSANAAQTRAQNAGNAYNPKLSEQVGHLVDNNRNPIKDASGNVIPYTSTSIGGNKYDPRLSAQVHHLVTAGGQPILMNGQQIPYSATAAAPPKTAAPLSANDRIKLQGALGTYVDTLKSGTPMNAKTGAAAVPPATIEQAIQKLATRNYFANPNTAQLAFQSLDSAYGVNLTPNMIANSLMGYGIDGRTIGSYGPPAPAGVTAPGAPPIGSAKAQAAIKAAQAKMNQSILGTPGKVGGEVAKAAVSIWKAWNKVRSS